MGGALTCNDPKAIKDVSQPGKRYSHNPGATTSYENIRSIYTFDKVIGKGAYGVVREGILKSDITKRVAIKIIEKDKIKKKLYLLEREIMILQTLDHPNIINFHETYQDLKYLYIVMEYCEGGELLDRIIQQKHLKESETCNIMYKLFSALNYIHKKKIVHRDLKPENILFSDNMPESELKIIDFGLSNVLKRNDSLIGSNDPNNEMDITLHTRVGTPLYVAPEVLKGEYTCACDIWSLGVITYLLLCGNPPFSSETEAGLFKKIEKGFIVFDGKEWSKISANAKDLILKCLKVNPKKRITAEQGLNHSWFITRKSENNQELNQEEDSSPSGHENKNILNILKNIKYTNKLKREVLKVFVNRLNEKEINNLKIAFQEIDIEKRGCISGEKLMLAMKNNGLQHSEGEIRNIINNITGGSESSENLYINYTDFITATLDLKTYFDQQKLWNLFKYFDTKNNNYITVDDLKEIMARGGRKIPVEELHAMIKENDLAKDGKLNFENFCKMLDIEQIQENQENRSKSMSEAYKIVN